MDIPQEVIENAPEGATHWNALNRMFYRLSETENRVWSHKTWVRTAMEARDAERSPDILLPLPPRDNHLAGWRPMSERPEGQDFPELCATASDREGIASFTPPPEPPAPPVRPERVSTLRHSRWIEGFR